MLIHCTHACVVLVGEASDCIGHLTPFPSKACTSKDSLSSVSNEGQMELEASGLHAI